MSRSKKTKIPQQAKNSKASAAGIAKQTAGRARAFADKKDMLAANTGDAEMDEGLEEYKEKQAAQAPEIAPKAEIRTYAVSIGMVIGLHFDKGEKILTGEALKKAIADNLMAHPAWNDLGELPNCIDNIELIDKSKG